MKYKATNNFRISRLVVTKGDVYEGVDIAHLLQLKLIQEIPEIPEMEEPSPSRADKGAESITDDHSAPPSSHKPHHSVKKKKE